MTETSKSDLVALWASVHRRQDGDGLEMLRMAHDIAERVPGARETGWYVPHNTYPHYRLNALADNAWEGKVVTVKGCVVFNFVAEAAVDFSSMYALAQWLAEEHNAALVPQETLPVASRSLSWEGAFSCPWRIAKADRGCILAGTEDHPVHVYSVDLSRASAPNEVVAFLRRVVSDHNKVLCIEDLLKKGEKDE